MPPGKPASRHSARRIVALLASIVALAGAAEAGEGARIVGATLLAVLDDPVALDHAVKSKIYPEDRDTMYVTLRGGGVSVFDVFDPAAPALAYLETDIPGISTPYTLEVHRDHLYIFSSHEPKMAVFRLDRDATPVPRAVITSKGFPE
jgi:hypothetical protein